MACRARRGVRRFLQFTDFDFISRAPLMIFEWFARPGFGKYAARRRRFDAAEICFKPPGAPMQDAGADTDLSAQSPHATAGVGVVAAHVGLFRLRSSAHRESPIAWPATSAAADSARLTRASARLVCFAFRSLAACC